MKRSIKIRPLLVLVFLVSVLVLPVYAQDDAPTVSGINYDTVIDDAISNDAFFDWWRLQAAAGDMIVVTMTAQDGLLPLIGLLNPAGDLVATSPDGQINDTVQLQYTATENGPYTIVATRVDNRDGTSTGSYQLDVRRANQPEPTQNPYQAVTFVCEGHEVVTAATLEFAEDMPAEGESLSHRITVYGINGFQPVIYVEFHSTQDFQTCNTDADQTIGDTFTLPGEDTRTVTADDLNTVSQLTLSGAELMDVITLRIGSLDGAPGRYMALIEGFTINPDNDEDLFEMRVGPRAAADTALQVYMVAAENSRLDPFMEVLDDSGTTCDDAGRRGCEAVPSFDQAGATLNNSDGMTLIGDRSDAGLLLAPGTPDVVPVLLTSRNGGTHGGYVLVLIGELPG
ncbi:MAG: hypothetical protein H6672_06710 [Anaerolineaceae bacterium]|nr:hypothetical protein [Anaerolineaceae bacterium]